MQSRISRVLLALVGLCLVALVAFAAALSSGGRSTQVQATSGSTDRVSVSSDNDEGNGNSLYSAADADGRHVAFGSAATNLVPDDTNDTGDIFVRDHQTGETTRVSVNTDSVQGDGESSRPAISADGRYVAFDSYASNLVSGDTNGADDIFVRDRQTGVTTRVSVDSAGNQGNADSGSNWRPAISADGRYVAFGSSATNLVPGDTNGADDIFVRDRQTGVTTRVSVDSAGNQGNGSSKHPSIISDDGCYVAFDSSASNLVSGDTNGVDDVFLYDCQTSQTTRLSVNGAGTQGNSYSDYPAISGGGGYVAFASAASNLVDADTNFRSDIFVRDLDTGVVALVSVSSTGAQGNGDCQAVSISDNGHYLAFESMASNLVSDDTNNSYDVFVHDRDVDGNGVFDETTGIGTYRASVDSGGNQATDDSRYPSMSADGSIAAFHSFASNLVSGDTNGDMDVFVRHWGRPEPTPTSSPTPTITDTPTKTPTPTPTVTPTPGLDADGDGCTADEEAYGAPAPKPGSTCTQTACYSDSHWYDFYDVPVPVNPDPSPNGPRNGSVTMGDVLATLNYVGTCLNCPPNSNGYDYDSLKDGDWFDGARQVAQPDGVIDSWDKAGRRYDRSISPSPNPPYEAGPPDGAVTIGDVLLLLNQVFLSCD